MKEILEVVIWPATVLIVVLILRRPLTRLLESTKKLKYKELELEFSKGIEQVQAEAKEALPEVLDKNKSSVEVDLYGLASISPTAAITEAWRAVESSAKTLITFKGHKL
jgi:hypothetical protein